MNITIVVPCYNEEEVISTTYTRLVSVADSVDWKTEMLFVNDGSSDGTLALLKNMARSDSRVRILSFSRNFGHQAAVSAGIRYARGDAAVIIDADLQDPPELIPEMVGIWHRENVEIVYGKRMEREGETIFKKLSAAVFYRLLNRLSATSLPTDTGDFRLLDRKVIDAFNHLPERNKYIRGLIPWLGFRSQPLRYKREVRLAGESKYPLLKMLTLAADGLISFSRKPLQLAMLFGILNILVSLLLAVYVFVSYFSQRISTVPGWASTVLIIIFFSGIQLFFLGVLGAYIGRIFDEVKARPEYIIKEIIENEAT